MANADSLRQKIQEQAELACLLTVAGIVVDLKNAAPRATGQTSDLIDATPLSLSPFISWQVESPTPQGEWVEEGTDPHTIGPVWPRFKAWGFLDQNGGFISGKIQIHHPGMPARPWFRPIVEQWSERLREYFS